MKKHEKNNPRRHRLFRRRKKGVRNQLGFSELEQRILLACDVINTNDAGPGSLRSAIECSNTTAGMDQITFDIPGPGPHTIQPLSALPAITDSVILDGTTEPDFVGTPIIELDGTNITDASGLRISSGADDSIVRGLVINRIANNLPGTRASIAIEINGADDVTISGNFLGTDVTGTIGLESVTEGSGVWVGDASGTTIGGTLPSERNVLSSMRWGIWFNANSSDNHALGNYIGTDITGTQSLGSQVGIIVKSPSTVIGGTTTGARNVVSGNTVSGIQLDGVGSVVQGNYIGIDVTGNVGLGNLAGNGVYVEGSNNLIGGSEPGAGNVISANRRGISLSGNLGGGSNVVSGNRIGTNAAGDTAVPNTTYGVSIDGSQNNRIGTNSDGLGDEFEGNVISGNGLQGVVISRVSSTNNTVAGNFIGTDAFGIQAIPNGVEGVRIHLDATGNLIGGSQPQARNVISGNSGRGINIAGTDSNTIVGNYIGTDVSGTVDLGNTRVGIIVTDGANNVIGGSSPGESNIISGNDREGIVISGADAVGNRVAGNLIGVDVNGTSVLPNDDGGIDIDSAVDTIVGGSVAGAGNVISGGTIYGINIDSATRTMIQGNFIGTDISGTLPVGNEVGVLVGDASVDTVIGGADPVARNVISANATHGVLLESTSTGSVVEGNFIGTDLTGTFALGNNESGLLNRAPGTQIGGPGLGEGNVISGNAMAGVKLESEASVIIEGNFIGSDATGSKDLGNLGSGIEISTPSGSNVIGGLLPGAANLIAYNKADGVRVTGGESQTIRANTIFNNTGIAIDLAGDGITLNDTGDADVGPNRRQNFPEINAVLGGASTQIAGSLASTPNTTFTLDFYSSNNPVSFGQGETYLGSTTATSDGSGQLTFNAILPVASVAGETIVATATDPLGNTSEFSAFEGVTISGAPTIDDDTLIVTVIEEIDDIDGEAASFGLRTLDVIEGQRFRLDGLFGSPAAGEHTVVVSWGDGSADSTVVVPMGRRGFTAEHSFADDDPSATPEDDYFVTVRVTNTAGDSGVANIAITTSNAEPAIADSLALSASAVNEGDFVTLSGEFEDPSLDDNHLLEINWGDGTEVQTVSLNVGERTIDVTHQYLDDTKGDTSFVELTVIDDDTGRASATVPISVENVAPTAGIAGPTNGFEGTPILLQGIVNDPGASDTYTYKWTVDDGVEQFDSGSDTQFTFVPSDQGTYNVNLTITDDDSGQSETVTQVLLVANVAPEISPGDLSIDTVSPNEGEVFSLSGSFTDPGSLDTHVVQIDWGDGSAFTTVELDAGARSFDGIEHIYADDDPTGTPADPYEIEVTVADLQEGDVATLPITVSNLLPSFEIEDDGTDATTIKLKSSVVTDSGTDDFTYLWDVPGVNLSDPSLQAISFPRTDDFIEATLTVTDDDGGFSTAAVVFVAGTTNDDEITIDPAGTDVVIEVTTGATSQSETFANASAVVVAAGDGNDTVTVDPGLTTNVAVNGGGGNDVITGGAGDDVITGGPGDDQLFGGLGADVLRSDEGDDELTGNDGDDLYVIMSFSDKVLQESPNEGIDTLDFSGIPALADNTTGIRLDLSVDDGTMQAVRVDGNVSLFGEFENLIGTSFQDTVYGTDADNVLFGGGGNDRLFANGENAATGDDGNDQIYGGDGEDTIVSGDGDDSLVGGGDDDSIYGGDGQDTIDGGMGDDTLVSGGNDGGDTIYGGDGDDSIEGGDGGDESLVGGDGDDTIYGGDGEDSLDGGDGDDSLVGGNDGGDTIYGGDGEDSITGGDGGDESLVGGDGEDTIYGGDGEDTIDGGDGDDSLVGGNDGGDTIYGGDGDDTINGGDGGEESLVGGGGNDTIYGGDGQDTIDGGGGDDSLVGGNDGGDTIYGGDGDDTIEGSDGGDESLIGGSGDDTIYGGNGLDAIDGGDGDDSLIGGPGNDTIYGGDGDDTISGSADDESLVGGDGDDTIYGGDGKDTIDGGQGDDTLVSGGNDGGDTIYGGDGDDSIEGGTGGDESLVGGDGDDTIYGGDGDDTIEGGSGDDSLVGGDDGGDTIYGGDGDDTITGSDGGEESLVGGNGDDTIYGGDGKDTIEGGAGDDSLIGGSDGGDTIYGGDGDDTIEGGAGGDESLVGGNGDDTIYGGDGKDTIEGGAGDDSLIGGDDGGDTIYGGDGDDTINGGDGGDESLVGGEGDDTIYGGDGEDTIDGGGGDDSLVGGNDGGDTIYGGDGDDTIEGSDAGDESLVGGEGDDTIYGGDGEDTLEGSGGDDTLVGGDGGDTIYGGDGDDSIEGGDGINESLVGGDGNDTIFGGSGVGGRMEGGLGDDYIEVGSGAGKVVFGGNGDDTIQGGDGGELLYGGDDIISDPQDSDWVVKQADANITLAKTSSSQAQLTAGTINTDLFDFDHALLIGGAGNNLIDATQFDGGVALMGGAGDDTLLGGDGDDTLNGGAGDDLLDGGAGSDTYAFDGEMAGSDTVVEAPNNAGDTLDFNGLMSPINLDLTVADQPQQVAANMLELTLQGTPAIENVVGTLFNDEIVGNDLDNKLAGGGGLDMLDGGAGADEVRASSGRVVYLDFETSTDGTNHVYDAAERDAIQARMVQDFAQFDIEVTQVQPTGGIYNTVLFNEPPVIRGVARPGGAASRIGWRGLLRGGSVIVDVNGFLGTSENQLPPTSENFVALSSTIASHEVAHLYGVRHHDAYGTLGLGIAATTDSERFLPNWNGAIGAAETSEHIAGSPASVGTSLVDALENPFFSERAALKLAFLETGRSIMELTSSQKTGTIDLAKGQFNVQEIGPLTQISVPNTIEREDANNFGLAIDAAAINVAGALELTAQSIAESDFYSFEADAGDLVTIEILSDTIRHRLNSRIDSVMRVYDSNGQQLSFGGTTLGAFNDDGLENTDSVILDLELPPVNGQFLGNTYVVEVDSFSFDNPEVPSYLPANVDAIQFCEDNPTNTGCTDQDDGEYELLIYRIGAGLTAPEGDIVRGGPGADLLFGGSGNETFFAGPDDIVIDPSGNPTIIRTNATPELAAIADQTVVEGSELTFAATATDTDVDDVLSFSLEAVNGHPFPAGAAIDSSSGEFIWAPQDNDDYRVRVVVADQKGAKDDQEVQISVSNEAPEIATLHVIPQAERTVALSATFEDASDLDTHTAEINWGDGTTTTGTVNQATGKVTAEYTYLDGTSYDVTLTLTDDDGGQATANGQVVTYGVELLDGTLYVVGTDSDDTVKIKSRHGGSSVRVETRFNHGSKQKLDFSTADIARIDIRLLDGDDWASVAHQIDVPAFIRGGRGDDYLFGGSGDDRLIGGGGDDGLYGARGDDRLYGGGGNDWLDGGLGDDFVAAGKGDDYLWGFSGNDILLGHDGDDHLYGGWGIDLLIGGLGEDRLRGGLYAWDHGPGDILIAGTTSYESASGTQRSLRQILDDEWIKRWDQGDAYDDIVNDLVQADGSLESGVNVLNDTSKDVLTGGKRTRELFFADLLDNDDQDELRWDKDDHVIQL